MTSVRLPDDLADKIDRMALDERRSRNQQIVVLLEQAVERREQVGV